MNMSRSVAMRPCAEGFDVSLWQVIPWKTSALVRSRFAGKTKN